MTALRLFVGLLSHTLATRKIPTTSPLSTPISIAALCKEGRLKEALHALHYQNHILHSSAYVNLLQCCIQKKALHQGKRIHALILNRNHLRFTEDVFLHNTVLHMYVKCGSLVDARGVFDAMIERDAFSWNVMIVAYRKHGLSEEALGFFHQMERNGNIVQCDEFTFASVLPACISSGSLEESVGIHRKIIRSGFHSNVVVTNALIDMYPKFGNIQKARVLFDKMQHRDRISWNAMIARYAQNGLHEEALEVFERMQGSDVSPNEFTFSSVLPVCVSGASLEEGVGIHRKIIRSGFHSDVVVTNALIDMYAKFGNIHKARGLFVNMKARSTISWNAMIAGYAQNGFHMEALEVFEGMQRSGVPLNEFSFASVLPACVSLASLEKGVDIHGKIVRSCFHSNVLLTNILIDMYAKFGNIQKARVLFNKMQQRDTISWTAMIAGYAHNGFHEEALKVFEGMQRSEVAPNEFTFGCVIPACVNTASLEDGVGIHRKIIKNGLHSGVVATNALIDMYAKFGNLHKARYLFDKMKDKTTISWNAIIAGYTLNDFHEEALKVFEGMQQSGIAPNEFTFASVLPAADSLEEGVDIHVKIVRSGFHSNVFVKNVLIDMYAKFGNIQKARVLFDKMQQRDTISWNAMIAGYARNGHDLEALTFFQKMQLTGFRPDSITFASVLPACASSASLQEGVDIHGKIVKSGCHWNIVVTNVLIDMYAKFGNLQNARLLFDKMQQRDTISWTAMIEGYAQNGFHEEALEVFEGMQRSDVVPDVVVTSVLIDMYAKFGNIQKARVLFDKMQQRDTISWTGMITGYAQNGYGLEALKCFQKMQLTGIIPDSITFASILAVCATFAALKWGMDIHGQITRCGFLSRAIVITALIDMYSKCGSIKKASVLFYKMHNRQTISWTAMIAGYARNGCSKEAIKLFEEMKHVGLSPNHVTFISVLSACSHVGFVKEGFQYFKSMNDYYNIKPAMQHYTCMVDLLGRAGRLDEAKDLINSMPVQPDASVWTCLLGACRIHNNLELGEFAAEHLLQLDAQNSVPYVLLSNVYAMTGRWNQIEKIRKMMKDRGIRKLPGCSWIVTNKEVHVFSVGDRSRPKSQETYRESEKLSQMMKVAGYFPYTRSVRGRDGTNFMPP